MVKKEDTNWLWHFRYGYLHFGLKTLSSKKMVTGLPNITPPIEICESGVVAEHEMKEILFHLENREEIKQFWSWCILTYVVRSLQHQMVTRNIS